MHQQSQQLQKSKRATVQVVAASHTSCTVTGKLVLATLQQSLYRRASMQQQLTMLAHAGDTAAVLDTL
jgi:hypothetical protein